ncbi:hypothetical protein [Pedomonas mirosovicensis]|nr:hypothetical protein [Pedomonas mirosovicensis]MCH8685246.1 hypothetical protein [Pedomonas mirosovicensis]
MRGAQIAVAAAAILASGTQPPGQSTNQPGIAIGPSEASRYKGSVV